ncbi:cysteine synthase family protein [Candidatus Babeliales bacterium]|nr:cysteine synthase family protein [Candidatus Babeliales bacterium]
MSHRKKLLEAIGNTPLVEFDLALPFPVLAKLEYLNPGGSIKDRSALFLVEKAEREGFLKPGGTIIEASSGNQGIALAMIGAARGYRVIITVPRRTSGEKVATMKAYGAQVVICGDTGEKGAESYCDVIKRLSCEIEGAFVPNQYFNKSNARAHYETTGPEIWKQTAGAVTHFFCGAGSCGTIMGVGKYLKQCNPEIKVFGIDAQTSAYSSKTPKPYQNEGIGIDYPEKGLFQRSAVDGIIPVSDDAAFARTKELAKRGVLVGPSSGAVVEGIVSCQNKLKADDVVVAIFADSGRAYLSKVFAEKDTATSAQKKLHVKPAVRI